MEDQLRDWIRLINTENVGPITFKHLVRRYGSPSEALKVLPDISLRGGKKDLKIPSTEFGDAEILRCQHEGGKLITWNDPIYPAQLKYIEQAPPVLYAKGNLDVLLKPIIGVVGSRNASLNGMKFTRDLCQQLGNSGAVIVSGLALGIDTAAHQGSLETGTIAVLGGGIDVVYPQDNKALQAQISEKGCLMSEFPMGTPPAAGNFPRRNRIIAGLSRGVIVVEALRKSGSMITAEYASDYGRDLFAVPGFPYDPRSEGPNQLIVDGAYPVRHAEDVLNNISVSIDCAEEFDPKDYFPEPGPEVRGLAEMREKIMDLLSSTPIEIDEVIRHTHLTPGYVWELLLELELSGKIERHPGNKVSLKL